MPASGAGMTKGMLFYNEGTFSTLLERLAVSRNRLIG